MQGEDVAKRGRSFDGCFSSHMNEVYHNVLEQVVTALCYAAGFDDVEASALESLMNIFHNYIKRVGEMSRTACEVAGRTIVCPSDVWFALTYIGHPVNDLPKYFQQEFGRGQLTIYAPAVTLPTSKTNALHVGVPRPHPSYVFDWMPSLPDPHTYIRTEISAEVDMSYEKVRESMANKKRNGVASLVNYMIRIYPRRTLFSPFEDVIFGIVRRMVETIGSQQRREEAFLAFRDLLTRNDIDNSFVNNQILVDHGIVTSAELSSGIELACLCKDGSIVDTKGDVVVIDPDTKIDLQSKEVDSRDCVEEILSAEILDSSKLDFDVGIMMEQLNHFGNLLVGCETSCLDTDECQMMQEKWAFEYIPEWCHLLEPSHDQRSYLAALISDLKLDDDYKKEKKDSVKCEERDETEEQSLDSPYFRPPYIIRSKTE